MKPGPRFSRRTRSPYDGAALGVYRGPSRLNEPPRVTPYRLLLLRAIEAGEVKAGQGQYVNAWRWHGTTSVTVTRWIREAIGCGWARVNGAHVELTDAGRQAMEVAS